MLSTHITSGIEAIAFLEDNEINENNDSLAEAEVKVVVRNSEEQQNDDVANDTMNEVETIEDTGAELFKDLQNMYVFSETIKKHALDPSMYAFINSNGQLSRLLNVKFPAVESLSKTGSNSKLINNIIPRLDKYIEKNISSNIKKCFDLFENKLNKLEHFTNKVMSSRLDRINLLISRLENDQDVPEKIVIQSNPQEDENKTVDCTVEINHNNEETSYPENEEPENYNNEVENNNEEETKNVSVEINSTEESQATMKSLGILNLHTTPIIKNMDVAYSGKSKTAMNDIYNFVTSVMQSVHGYTFKSKAKRKITVEKRELLESLYMYKNILKKWNNRNMLHHACRNLAVIGKECRITNSESLYKVFPIFKAMNASSAYLRTTKKAMDKIYYNLQFLTFKMLNEKKI